MNKIIGTGARSPPYQKCKVRSEEKNKNINHIKFKENKMRILFINNNGAGFADFINIEEGMAIEKLFKQKMPHEETSDYLIRVNRQPVPKDYILKENDRVTITPTKIDGAAY